MPNRRTHVVVGGVLAAGLAWAYTHEMESDRRSAIMFTAAASGMIGGALPDLLEPALSPNHRAFFHSLLFAGALGGLSAAKVREALRICRVRADEDLATRRLEGGLGTGAGTLGSTWSGWDLVAGVLIGVMVGYGSHLFLDGQTPRGLPLS